VMVLRDKITDVVVESIIIELVKIRAKEFSIKEKR